MSKLVPNAFLSPLFPKVPGYIVRPPPHPVASLQAGVLGEGALLRLRKSAGLAASGRLFAQRIVDASAKPGRISDYLKHLVTDEYIEYLRSVNDVSEHNFLASARAYIDYLTHAPLTTHAIDLMVGSYLVSRGAFPSGVGFMGFPRASCTSVNEVVAHGIPDLRPLEQGDILNVDLTCFMHGFFGDCSATFIHGKSSLDTSRLAAAPQQLVFKAIPQIRDGMTLYDLADLMDKERRLLGGFKCVSYFCGHSIGQHLHEKPNIFHTLEGLNKATVEDLREERLFRGQVITIEPILIEEGGDTKGHLWPDGWTWVTGDGSRTAQHEEMILVNDDYPEVLTVPDDQEVGL